VTNVIVTDISNNNQKKLCHCLGSKCLRNTNIFYSRLLKLVGSMELVHCAILLAVIFQAHCSVSVSEKSIEVRTGDEAQLSCTTSSNIRFCQFKSPSGEPFILEKGIQYEDGRITYDGEDSNTECGVKITNVMEKDNGQWTCSLTTIANGQAATVEETVSVIVSRPPSDVHIEVEGIPASNIVVNFKNSRSRQVSCIADGARPAATFSWMLGEDLFNGDVEDLASVQHEDGSVKQVQVLNYQAEPGHNGKPLTCIVNHNGFSRQDKEMNKNMATLDLDVQFQPVAADHPQAFYNLQVGEQKEILMSFRAHPRPTQVVWTMYDDSSVAQGGQSLNQRFTADVLKDGPNEGMFTARLVISEVMEKDAGSNNKLSVSNELGTTIYPFTLSLGDKPAAVAGTGPVVAIVIVAIIIIVVIVVAVIARSQNMLCFADKTGDEDTKKAAAQFDALEKGDDLPEKEPIKEATDIKKEPVITESKTETVSEKPVETDDKKSNGNPV